MRFVNDALRVYFEDPEGRLTSNIVGLRVASPRGTLLYYQELIDYAASLPGARLRAILHYLRFGLHAGIGVRDLARSVGTAMTMLLVLPAAILRRLDSRRLAAPPIRSPSDPTRGKAVVARPAR